jgi:hypothetical protein
LRELVRLAQLGIFQDAVHIQVGAVEDLIDLADSIRFIPRTLVRQRLRILRLIIRKILLKDFRQTVRKDVRERIVVEIFAQESLQRRESARSNQTGFQAAPPQNLPLQRCHIDYQHLIDNIDRLYRCEHMGEKLAS